MLRSTPTTFPLASAAGSPWDVLRGLRHQEEATREWHAWCHGDGQPSGLRLLAAQLPPEAAARRRQRRTAQKQGRTPPAAPGRLAAWGFVVTPWEAADWPLGEGLRLDRARWYVELVCQRMTQLLRLNQLRRPHPPGVEATGRAFLIAWGLPEGRAADIRAVLATLPQVRPRRVSRGLLTG